MAAIAHGQSFASGENLTNSATYVTVLTEPASSFVDNGTYLLMVTSSMRMLDLTALAFARVVHASTEFPGSEQIIEMGAGTLDHGYYFPTVFTQPATAEAISVEMHSNGTQNMRMYDTLLTWIRLDADLIENTDWFFSEQNDEASPPELPTAFGTEFANLTFTPGNNNDDWLVISGYRIGTRSNNNQFEARLNREGVDLTPHQSFEGEDTTGEIVHFLPRVFTLTNSSHTFRMQALEEAASANHVHQYSNIFALRLNAFEDHEFDYIDGQLAAQGGFTEVAAITPFTPATAGDFFVFGYYGHDVDEDNSTRADQVRVQIGGTTVPSGYNTGIARGNTWDPSDRVAVSTHSIENLAASSQDIDLDGSYTGGVGNWEHRLALAFSMELPGGNGNGGGAGRNRSKRNFFGLM